MKTCFFIVQHVCLRGSASIALKQLVCKKRLFSAKYRWLMHLTHLTLFSLKNAFNRGELLVFAITNLTLHCSKCLHAQQRFHCVKTVSVQKTRFQHALTRFSASNVNFAEKRGKMQEIAFLCNNLILHSSK